MSQTKRATPSLDLFPAISPYSMGFLQVDDIHNLYWEQSGNPEGVPVVVLHGGPGAGATSDYRRFFDPDHYRIIIFDQRGAGRSQPLGCVENNTLEHLLSDLERLRQHLRIPKWHLFGGSWGSTLALSYAIDHPQQCHSLILRSIFLLEQQEIDWFLYGMKMIFPEAWDQFAGLLPSNQQDRLLEGYYDRLNGDDETEKMNAAISWSLYESACSSLLPNYMTITTDEQKKQALALARIEAHYFKNQVISPENSLINRIGSIRAIPSIIVHGRYDILCPMYTARRLHHVWPEADYIVVPDGGHSALDPAIRSRLIEATETVRTLR